jgi:hypothetical protein
MERGRNVIRLLIPTVMFLSCVICNAQGRIAPQFIPDKNKNGDTPSAIPGYLGTLNDSTSKKAPECFGGIGYFSFIVKSDGDVELKHYEGHLPANFVENIKKNILQTKGKWIPEIEFGEYVNSQPLIFIFFVNLGRSEYCDVSNPLFRANEVEIGYTLMQNINRTNLNMIVSDVNYLLPIGGYWKLY